MEVEQGDLVPGLGRIDAIRKQDGKMGGRDLERHHYRAALRLR